MTASENPSGESSAELASESAPEKWELMERITELETTLAEREERDRIRELEIAALRHELELRFAYNSSLEKALEEQRTLTEVTRLFESERVRADHAERTLAAEQARLSYQVVNRLVRLLRRLSRHSS
jgi:hypothetical protein